MALLWVAFWEKHVDAHGVISFRVNNLVTEIFLEFAAISMTRISRTHETTRKERITEKKRKRGREAGERWRSGTVPCRVTVDSTSLFFLTYSETIFITRATAGTGDGTVWGGGRFVILCATGMRVCKGKKKRKKEKIKIEEETRLIQHKK